MYIEQLEWHGILTYRFIDNYPVGSVEIIKEMGYNYIENIFIKPEYRHQGYLRKFIVYLRKLGTLVCLPLPEHVEKFKHLGFSYYKQEGEDTFYILR